MKIKFFAMVLGFVASAWLPVYAQAGQNSQNSMTRVTWHGHAAFEVTTPKGKVLLIDPWLKNPLNPAAKDGKDPVAALKKVDYILVTHGHGDHVGESVEIAKKTGAHLVSNFELASAMVKVLGFPKDQVGMDTMINPGAEISIADGEVTVAATPAIHSSGLDRPGDAGDKEPAVYGGTPMGFVLKIKNGPTIYHTGDTAYFSDMKLIGEKYAPDLALINIGGHFGMEPDMAARAATDVRAKLVVPHHYKTFPLLTQDPSVFIGILKSKNIPVNVMQPGSTLVFSGKSLKK